jgi:hypothetical protein
MHISVHVRSGAATSGELALTTHCLIVFASVDSESHIPRWNPISAEDKALEEHAVHLIRYEPASLPDMSCSERPEARAVFKNRWFFEPWLGSGRRGRSSPSVTFSVRSVQVLGIRGATLLRGSV